MAEVTVNPWRKDFPILAQTMNGRRLAFLDSGASAQKPQCVIDTMTQIYQTHYSNIHRGLYEFSQILTGEFESARNKVADFIKAPSPRSIIFTRNSTESINLVAQSWGRTFLSAGDEIILTEMEHHANFVPWHILKNQIGIVIKYIPVLEDGSLDLTALQNLLTDKTRLVALTHVSNVLGTVNPVEDIIKTVRSHADHIKVLIDGSQAVVHGAVDVAALDADFYVFTGHKLYAPTGVGVLYGRESLLEKMPPWQGGGDMIEKVTLDGVTYAELPNKFEAGTPAIVEVIGLGTAIDYVSKIGLAQISKWEHELLVYATKKLLQIKGLKILGTTKNKAGIISFTVEGCPASDLAMILDQMGVAVRSGHHCCQPLMGVLGVEGTIRASIGLYTDKDDIDQLIAGIIKAKMMLT